MHCLLICKYLDILMEFSSPLNEFELNRASIIAWAIRGDRNKVNKDLLIPPVMNVSGLLTTKPFQFSSVDN